MLDFLTRRAVPAVEQAEGAAYRRSLRLAGGPAAIEVRADGDRPKLVLRPTTEARQLAAVAATRRLLDLDCDPDAIRQSLGGDPLIGPLVRADPGRRLPGHVDPAELAIRAVIGQQVSVAGAATVAGRLVRDHGERLAEPVGTVTHLFPEPAALAALSPEELPMPRARGRCLIGLAAALADGSLTLSSNDPASTRESLLELPGIGPWTASYIEMRGLGNADAFLPGDLGVRRALERLGEDGSPANAARLAESWRPYRAYALQHLWSTLDE